VLVRTDPLDPGGHEDLELVSGQPTRVLRSSECTSGAVWLLGSGRPADPVDVSVGDHARPVLEDFLAAGPREASLVDALREFG